jgi:hypothetical protein
LTGAPRDCQPPLEGIAAKCLRWPYVPRRARAASDSRGRMIPLFDLPAFYDYASGTLALLIAGVTFVRLLIKALSEWRDYRGG